METPIPRISLRDVLVDFLGGLVPGLVFVSMSALLLGWPALFLINAMSTDGGDGLPYPPFRQTIQDLSVVAEAFWIELLVFTLMLSYVMGHIFYRQDPKEPDRQSFTKVRGALEENGQLNSWVVENEAECEFPYPNLYGYLSARGLEHLAVLVPWRKNRRSEVSRAEAGASATNASSTSHPEPASSKLSNRTKNFINILKIRMAFYYPDKMGIIARNEAHVRLMSSTFYMGLALILVSATGFVLWIGIAIGPVVVRSMSMDLPYLIPFIPPLLICLGLLAAALWTRATIRKFLHYQRVREIVYVLETAYTASLKEPLFFHGLQGLISPKPPNDGEEAV